MGGQGALSTTAHLPVEGALEGLIAHLDAQGAAVLSAPPGSGKTTRAPLALMERLASGLAGRWGGERVLVLQPRRVAARAVAEFMAERLGERVGGRVGYQVRFERAVSAVTRVEVLTEGLLNRRMAGDPELTGVGCVVLDEFHERSLQADLALATLLELRAAFRPDLRLLIMSATLGEGAEALAARVGGALIEVEGRAFPVEVIHDERPSSLDPCERAPGVIVRAWGEGRGSVLAFFPGRREIEVARGALERLLPGVPICELFGGQAAATQRAALNAEGPRRVILSTNIAETSLTIDGVGAVVDTGLARVSRYDARLGVTQLELQGIAQDAATQRAGRAGRTRAGVCYRLWTAHEHAQRPAASEPEVRRSELTEALAHIARWAGDWRTFEWYEAPPAHHLTRAEEALRAIGALHPTQGSLTPLGEALAALPLAPSLALSALFACALDGRRGGERALQDTALLAALASADRDPLDLAPGASRGAEAWLRVEAIEDLTRGHAWPELRGAAAREAQQVAQQVARAARAAWEGLSPTLQGFIEGRLSEALSGGGEGASALSRPSAAALAFTLGAPLSIGRRREEGGGRVLLASGGEAQLDPRGQEDASVWLIALSVRRAQGLAPRVTLALPTREGWLQGQGEVSESLVWSEERGGAYRVRLCQLGAITLSERASPAPASEEARALLRAEVLRAPWRALTLEPAAARWLERARWLASEPALARQAMPRATPPAVEPWWGLLEGDERFAPDGWGARVAQLVEAVCADATLLKHLRGREVLPCLLGLTPLEESALVERLAPDSFEVPTGQRARVHYEVGRPPYISVYLQSFLGTSEHPRLGGVVPLQLHLLSPAQRPLQITSDLPSFWRSGYLDVRRELRARYPKHHWPEDPLSVAPQRGAKKRF